MKRLYIEVDHSLHYYESRLHIDFNNIDDIQQKLTICEQIGLKYIILNVENIKGNILTDFKSIINSHKMLNLNLRINLKPESIRVFKNSIKKLEKIPCLLSIETSNKDLQLKAARDSRVDLISYSHPDILKTLNTGVISLTKQNKSYIEFSLSSLREDNRYFQSKNFRNLYRFLHFAIKEKANYIISGNFEHPYDIRHPKALVSLCCSLLDIPILHSKNAVGKNVESLLKRKEDLLNKNIIENGVKLIE